MYQILIAEDELIERMVLKRTLMKKFGDCCRIFEAANGKEALELFHSENIQIAVLDIEMPGIKGIDAAERMRAESEDCCIIFLTAYDKFEYAKRAITVRAMEYLLKPYSERELLSVIEAALHRTDKVMAQRGRQEAGGHAGQEGHGQQETGGRAGQEPHAQGEPLRKGEARDETRLSVMVAMVEEYIRENYSKDISMQDAARALHYSEPYFCKMFKQQYGVNFTAYLTDFRIEEAKKMLRQPNVNVKEIGGRVGYEDPTYFARVFRRVTGQSPSEYRMAQLDA